MRNNPFLSKVFTSTWLKHFASNKTTYHFDFINGVSFLKDKYFPIYFNAGKNITNGMYYDIDLDKTDYLGKTFLIYDVPEYYGMEFMQAGDLNLKKIRQYKGYSANFQDFETFEDYFINKYKSSSRYKFRKGIKRLETCFDIEYKIIYGEISKEEYEFIFKHFKLILSKRFGSLGLDNSILSEWDYYHELVYNMILEKKALINVVYNNGTPIGLSIGFLADEIMYFAISTFNIDYIKFNLGHTVIIKLMEWCFENDIKTFDFSKGQYEYKDRWANHQYNYHCHILYDSSSIKAKIVANIMSSFFKLKQYLRDKKVNFLYSILKFKLKGISSKYKGSNYAVSVLKDEKIDLEILTEINLDHDDYSMLRKPLFSYLFSKAEKLKTMQIYKNNSVDGLYYAVGANNNLKISKSN